jgi:large repetitive protein
VADYSNAVIRKITPDGTTSVIAGNGTPGHEIGADLRAALPPPRGIAVDAQGVLYVAVGHSIVKIYQP